MRMPIVEDRSTSFLEFARIAEAKLRYALVASHGAERGLEATNDALVHGWQKWDRVRRMRNPVGYLYRVGQRKARRRRHSPRADPVIPEHRPPWIEPHLSAALSALTARQREVVVLVEAFEWTHREAAEVLRITPSSVQTHLERGLARLRESLGVDRDE